MTITKKVVEVLDKQLEPLDGLNETSIKALHYFLKEVMKMSSYQINVIYDKTPKEIVIRVFSADKSQEFFCKEKDKAVFPMLVEKLGIPNYKIRFATKNDFCSKTNNRSEV